ncbi:MAG: Asp-tRNA(Asn)/Glu-tRNA(Gln) amidotransferase subunit GatB [Methanosphaera sp.]|nr:Asp-tRNA(Asn)/Glu-tRNA(Gln) amidotransferase subunit GatB [Methanosphaera sp.]
MYKTVIGLEVHCELKSNSKNFSSAKNGFSDIPNSNVSVVDLGMPGILPVVNKQSVRNSIKMALAMNCTIPEYLTFERKNYFYPDLPKGYQITQFKHPIGTNGYIMIDVNGEDKKILIHDTHLEEDTASMDHYNDYSLLDYNRCGVPLLETVTEPCINSADEAVAFLEGLRSIFLYTNTSYARSDKGQIRCDVNVSLMKETDKELGTRVEIKNINSFSGVKEAILCEVARQTKILNDGGKIEQETRRYDEGLNETFTMRSKEDAIDYRYFTDPNLPPIKIDKEWVNEIKNEIPKLHNERYRIYTKEYNINSKDAYTIVRDKSVSDFYEECITKLNEPVLIANWLCGDVMKYLNRDSLTINESKLTESMLTGMIKLIIDGKINGKQAKEVLEKMMNTGKDANTLVEELGMTQISNEDEIREIILTVIDENKKLIDDYKAGKNVFGYMVGLIMKKTNGKANPVITSKVLQEEINKF